MSSNLNAGYFRAQEEFLRNAQRQYDVSLENRMTSTVSGFYPPPLEVINKDRPPAPINQPTQQPEKKSMFKEISNDVKSFITEHRSMLYFVAIALIIDHFIFNGAFKARLQTMAEKFVAKVEQKVEKAVE